MSSALNLIIARGFPELGTALVDGMARGKSDRQREEANDVSIANARQDQAWQAEDRQAAYDAQANAATAAQAQQALLAKIPEIDARLRQNPNDPEARAMAVEVYTQLSGPKEAASGIGGLLYPQQAEAAGGFGRVNPGDYTPDSLSRYQQTGNYSDLVRQYAPTAPILVNTPGFGVGLVDRNNPDNRTMLTTPDQERAAATDKVIATQAGKSVADAASDLPRVKENARQMSGLLDQLDKPDVLKWVYGPASLAPVVPGTPQADSVALWGQLNGQAFMQAFSTLKGGGQITEKEGEKATVAITRLSDRKISAKAAKGAIAELRTIIKNAEGNAEKRASKEGAQSGPTRISSDADYDALPSGAEFIAPDGSRRKKP